MYTYCHTLSLHDALPIYPVDAGFEFQPGEDAAPGNRRNRFAETAQFGIGDTFDLEFPALCGSVTAIHLEQVVREQGRLVAAGRSEEHTSELQSLMRISYAGFCLKKKHTTKVITTK